MKVDNVSTEIDRTGLSISGRDYCPDRYYAPTKQLGAEPVDKVSTFVDDYLYTFMDDRVPSGTYMLYLFPNQPLYSVHFSARYLM